MAYVLPVRADLRAVGRRAHEAGATGDARRRFAGGRDEPGLGLHGGRGSGVLHAAVPSAPGCLAIGDHGQRAHRPGEGRDGATRVPDHALRGSGLATGLGRCRSRCPILAAPFSLSVSGPGRDRQRVKQSHRPSHLGPVQAGRPASRFAGSEDTPFVPVSVWHPQGRLLPLRMQRTRFLAWPFGRP